MDAFQYFFWLSQQSLLAYTWPVGIILLLVVSLVTRGDIPFGWKQCLTTALASLQLLVPVLMLVLGTLLRNDTRRPAPVPGWPEWLMLCSIVYQVAAAAYIVKRLHHDKLLVFALSGIQVFISVLAMIVASMSISGDWL
jgi:hypothetical protein